MLGRQVLAAIICVLLFFTVALVPYLGAFVANYVSDGQMLAHESSALFVSLIFGGFAALLAIAALVWLKLLYGTVGALVLGAIALAMTAALDGFVGPGLAGGAVTLVVAAVLGLLLHRLIVWATPKQAPHDLAQEF